MNLNYPKKPWRNGQRAVLVPGMEFMYSSSIKKWIPITPGYENENQLQESFGVSTIIELAEVFKEETKKVAAIETRLDSDIKLSGRIWKSSKAPSAPNANDIWLDPSTGISFSYDANAQAWVQQK